MGAQIEGPATCALDGVSMAHRDGGQRSQPSPTPSPKMLGKQQIAESFSRQVQAPFPGSPWLNDDQQTDGAPRLCSSW